MPFHFQNEYVIYAIKLRTSFTFVLECPIYLDIRKLYINSYYFKRPNMYKMVELFNTTNKKQLRNISVYIYKAFEIRRNEMLSEMLVRFLY